MEVADVNMRPVSPSDPNKENILISESTPNIRPISAVESMDYSEESDENAESMSTIPGSQETRHLLSDSDSDVPPKVENSATSSSCDVPSKQQNAEPCSEPEDGEITYETEDIFPDHSIENWDPVNVTAEKLAERARRFGLTSASGSELVPKEELLKLYQSLGIPLNLVRSGKLENIRLDTLHMRGRLQKMNGSDILDYFGRKFPMCVEWINDFSCNVAFPNDISAAKALLDVSSEMIVGVKPTKKPLSGGNEDYDSAAGTDSEDWRKKPSKGDGSLSRSASSVTAQCEAPVPSGKWRRGRECSKGRSIVLRFATEGDERRTTVYNKQIFYQNYNHSHRGSAKRRSVEYRSRYSRQGRRSTENDFASPLYRTDGQEQSSDSDDQNTLSAGGKKIKMRMYADDVQGSWQKVRSGSTLVNPKPSHRSSKSGASSDEATNEHHSATKRDVPSRYKIWIPLAEDMARESELAEKSNFYGPSRSSQSYVDNDLRAKLRVTAPPQTYSRQVTKRDDLDLRRKLQFKRRDEQVVLRSPLLISVRNRDKTDSDSSS